ncbi:MAG: hypothetical protein EP343_28140 [Deltaproteobacteria bacterium]|nr:MAG: hypothetical protein EP343_28140 [Deltaproteobacteria bacterium]
MFRLSRLRPWLGALLLLGALCWSSTANAVLFQGDGKDYVVYVDGDLWVFSKFANTQITVRDLSTNQVVWSPSLSQAAQQASRSFSKAHLRVESNQPINVATGNLLAHNASGNTQLSYATYLISETGSRLGTTFIGFVSSDIIVFCHKGSINGNNPRVTIEDLSELSGADNDDKSLNRANSTVDKPEVTIWQRGGFDDDLVRITTNQDCAVMAGHNVHAKAIGDWSIMPPSMEPGEGGLAYGTRFYLFVHKTMAITALEDNTKVTIRDFSDGDDGANITLNRNQVYTPIAFGQTYNNYTQSVVSVNGFDDDYVEVVADKPVWVFVGPTSATPNSHSVAPVSIPIGNGEQEAYCFVQKGASNNLQVFVDDNSAEVEITTIAGDQGITTTTRKVGGQGGATWQGPTNGPYWYEANNFSNELVFIRSTKPMSVFCGGLGGSSWQSYISYETLNETPEINVPNNQFKYTIRVGDTLDLSLAFSDPNGDTLTWLDGWSTSSGNPPTGANVTGSGNSRNLKWTPVSGQEGTYFWDIDVTDSGVPPLTTSITIEIEVVSGPANRPPVFVSQIPTTNSVQLNDTFTYNPRATDPDGDPVTITLTSSPPGATYTNGQVSWTASSSSVQIGNQFTFTLEACDNKNACTQQTWTVVVVQVNNPPRFTSTPIVTIREGDLFDYQPVVVDPDPGDQANLRFTNVSIVDTVTLRTPGGAVTNLNTGRITWTPNNQQGGKDYWIEIVVCDPQGSCVIQQWTLRVIDVFSAPPQITSVPPTKGSSGVSYVYSPTFVDSDLPNDSHTWTLNTAPNTATFDNATGRITWTPTQADVGQSFAFELVLCDRTQLCATQRWAVAVTAPNRAPTITSTAPTANAFVNRLFFYQATATDPDPNEILTWSILQGPSAAIIGSNTGALQWTPIAADRGKTITFNIRVCDRANACDSQTWTTTVVGPNQPPAFTSQPPTTVLQGDTYSYNIVAVDPDNDPVTITLLTGPQGANIQTSGTTVTLTWPTDASNGGRSYSFEVEACDNNNNCAQQTWTVFVNNINDPPVITSQAPTKGTSSVQYVYAPTATDPDPNDTLTWTLKSQPQNITVNFSTATGRLTWTPSKADETRTDLTFEIEVKDAAGLTDTEQWTVTVGNSNNPPKITSTAPTTATEDAVYTYSPTAVDPDTGDTQTWTLDQGPTGATFDTATGKITWTPGDTDVTNSPINFKITVCDSANACDSETWTVTVTDVNDPPVFTSKPNPLTARVGNIYTYPSTASDPDPSDQGFLKFSLTTPNGNAAIDPTSGVFTWTPAPGDANNAVKFTIQVCDDETPTPACDTQDFTLQVGLGNRPPTITSTAPTEGYVGEDIDYQALATDPDVNDSLSWTLESGPTGASVDKDTGKVSWTPSQADAGKTVSFEIKVCDDANPPLCDTQSFKVTVGQKCRLDINCPGKQICVQKGRFRVCIPEGCSVLANACQQTFFCKDGTCTEDKCPNVTNCPTNICRPDTGCIRSCSGVQCPAGSRCIDGSCEPTPCIANACSSGEVCDSSDTLNPNCVTDPCQIPGQCKHGRVCDYDRCVDDPCSKMQCPKGQVCEAGQCKSPTTCEVDIDCIGEQVCENKQCVDPGCYTRTPQCQNTGDLCLATSCKENPCATGGTLQCTTDQFCRPTDGKCGNVCDKTAQSQCTDRETCKDGACQPDPCKNKSCGAGQTCIGGTCTTDRCAPGNVCKYGRVCDSSMNRCIDDPCLYTKCPTGLTCRLGQCIPTSCRVDKDCPGNQICLNGQCVDPKCPDTPCAPGELCVNGVCTKDPCQGVQCPAGQYCRGGNCINPCGACPAGTTCVDGKCVNDPCANIQCKDGEVCQNGSCVPECCTADSCKFNRICRACACYDPPCGGVTCPNGTECNKDTGNCQPPTGTCDVDKVQCSGDDVCIDGKCTPPGCYNATCEAGKVCLKGQCTDNPCATVTCKDNEFCRPVDGTCVPYCDCKPGEVCNNGVCEANPCDGKTCPSGQVCRKGNCEPELPCDKPDNADTNICKYTRVCANNTTDTTSPKANCGDDLCTGVVCKTGYKCTKGQCWPDPCAGENPGESCSAENTGENTGESATNDGGPGDGGTNDGPVEYTTVATGGCGCQNTSGSAPLFMMLLLLFGALIIRRRRAA